ncbi:histidine kinase [Vibrio ichthyoenteri ATCC 700023]|uniref:histidine kinase n=1 Tax=Vibrio ichthyoenteri ATCC 700023 TaxID=870968 RepID=F9S3M7_9VIBR|nr:hybrid sensor histidine kinase/response regulator [Vibrio ichthyoenteri]EGU37852.1 histidine kinase [Vibrio ichthyoenteri ATCC 700023]
MFESFVHPVLLLLLAVASLVLGWTAYFVHSLRMSRGLFETKISIPYLFYSMSVFAWILSNAFFYSPLLLRVDNNVVVSMALLANLASASAFTFAYLVTRKLVNTIDSALSKNIQNVVFVILISAAIYWNHNVGHTVDGVSVYAIGRFHIDLGEQAALFFLSAITLIVLSFRNILLYSRRTRPLQHIKSLYMLFGISVFMVSTIVIHALIPLFWADFTMSWLPPALAMTEVLLMGYALITSRFYSNRHILFSLLSVLLSCVAITVPLVLVLNSISVYDFTFVIASSCLVTGLLWSTGYKSARRLSSLLVYGQALSPNQKINSLSREFQKSTNSAIEQIAQTLDIDQHDLQLVYNLQDEKAYTSQLYNQNSVLIFEEIEEQVLIHSSVSSVLQQLYLKMKRENVALVLPIFDHDNQMSHLLIARKKRSGHLYFCEEIHALQYVLKKAQGYINADRKVHQAQALANSIAHEMRNPLAQVQLQFEQLNVKLQQNAPRIELEKELLKGKVAIDRGRQLIDIILREVNDASLEQEPAVQTSIKQAVEQAVERYAFDSEEMRQRLSVNITHDFYAKINDTLFNFVIFNLLRNATYYFDSYPKSSIDISTITGKYENFVVIRDSGPGIPKSLQTRIFDDFYSHNKSGGSGLGLGYCRRVMKAFGGSIQCYSKVGSFTEFHLSFPVDSLLRTAQTLPEIDNTNDQNPNKESGQTLRPQSYTILVVDDKEVQRQLVKLLLNQLGYDAILANNGQVALEIIQNNSVDLVFMDIQMPVMNGFEAATIIKQTYPHIPVYALSGESGQRELDKISQIMDGHLTKPTSKEALLATIQKRRQRETIEV